MAPVHKVIVKSSHANLVPKKAEPMLSSEVVYCVCRQSHINGFMICCDNCNVWFHGDCIGLPADIGEQHDTFYCDECFHKNPLLKSTYKASPPTTAKAQKPSDAIPKTPKKARIINSAGVRQRPRRKSTFAQEPSEAPLPKTPAPKTPKTPKRRGQAVKIPKGLVDHVEEQPEKPTAAEKRPKRTAKKIEPIEKGIQCDILTELAQQVHTSSDDSDKKRGTCITAFCSQIARRDSRYCSDECGSFTTLTNAFSIRRLPKMVHDNMTMALVNNMLPTRSQLLHKLIEKSKSTEPEKEKEPKAKEIKVERRKSRYRSPTNSLAKSPDVRKSPAKKPKPQEEHSSSRSRSSRKSVAESRHITRSDSESQQDSKHKTAKDSKTSSKRAHSNSPCGSPKSYRTHRNASKTVPNSPVAQKKTSKQKHDTNSPPGQSRVGRKRKLSVDSASTHESKTPQASRMASPEPTSINRKPVPATSNQRKRKQSFSEAISYDTTLENTKKTKTVSCIVSNTLPTERALLFRKKMMKKMS